MMPKIFPDDCYNCKNKEECQLYNFKEAASILGGHECGNWEDEENG